MRIVYMCLSKTNKAFQPKKGKKKDYLPFGVAFLAIDYQTDNKRKKTELIFMDHVNIGVIVAFHFILLFAD